jgi:Mn2+/Fe2+ NRAMP family transporter
MAAKETPTGASTPTSPPGPPIPTTLKGYLHFTGPGLLVAMAWLSAGDLVTASVSGADYGYALIWALVMSLVARYFFVSAIGKYILANNEGTDSIMAGFRRLWRGLPILMGVVAFGVGFIVQTYIIKGAASALYHLMGRPGDSAWGVFVVAVLLVGLTTAMLVAGRQYKVLELVARLSVVALLITFLVIIGLRGFDVMELLRGLVFEVPDDAGGFRSIVIVAAIIGAVGGSAANLLYPYFLRDKGWTGPEYRKLQIVDLLIGIVAMVVINLAVWIMAAETVQGREFSIQDENDLAQMMQLGIGAPGPILLWLGLFFVTFNSFPAYSYGFTKVLLDGVRHTFPRVSDPEADLEGIPGFRWLQIGVLLCMPLLFSLPVAPNFVVLTIAGQALQALTGPIIIVGIIILTSSRRFMRPAYVNRWWETVALLLIGAIGLWATFGTIRSFFA